MLSFHLECAEVARVEDLGQGGDDDGDCRRVVRRHPGNQRQGLFFILPITNMPAPPSQNYPVAPLAHWSAVGPQRVTSP